MVLGKPTEDVSIIWKIRIIGLDARIEVTTESTKEQPMAISSDAITHT
jgi:hypothetical protein